MEFAHGVSHQGSDGTEDMAIATNNSVDYYQNVVALLGQRNVDDFMRFYLIAGFGHFQGAFTLAFDGIGTLDAWVSTGIAPKILVGADANPVTAGRTRPLCIYPGWPEYVIGDPNAASSFKCVEGRVPFGNGNDVNGDGKVDCTDLALVKASFGKHVGQAGFDPRADINADGVVDFQDWNSITSIVPVATCTAPQ